MGDSAGIADSGAARRNVVTNGLHADKVPTGNLMTRSFFRSTLTPAEAAALAASP